jgi:hypothetical protein
MREKITKIEIEIIKLEHKVKQVHKALQVQQVHKVLQGHVLAQ